MEENQKMLAVKERNKTQFHTLTDQEVLSKTKHLASEERKITAQIIEVLEEIDTRKLYAKLGFSSLFDFLTEEIGYSAGAAQRRINSMRVVRSIPEVKDKIIEGSLNLSNVAQAQKFFNLEAKNSEPLSIEEKKIVLSKLENKSTREAEKELLSLSSNPIQMISDRVKPVTSEHSEIRFMASNELIEKLNQVRGLIAHKNPQASMAEVIDAVVDIGIKQLSKNKFKTEKTQPPTDATLIPTPTPTQVNTKSKPNVSSADTDTPPKSGSSSRGPLADREAGSSPASPPKKPQHPL